MIPEAAAEGRVRCSARLGVLSAAPLLGQPTVLSEVAELLPHLMLRHRQMGLSDELGAKPIELHRIWKVVPVERVFVVEPDEQLFVFRIHS